jgi:hypothetical protein
MVPLSRVQVSASVSEALLVSSLHPRSRRQIPSNFAATVSSMAETTRRYLDGAEGASDPEFRGRSGAGPRRRAESFDSPRRGRGSPAPSIHIGDVRRRQVSEELLSFICR